MKKIVVTTLSMWVALGCVSTSQPGTGTTVPPVATQVPMGQDFTLSTGQSGRVSGTPITMTFDSVEQDSRCPSDVNCVWAGDASLRLTLQSTAGSSLQVSLHTNVDPRTADYAGYRIRVMGLDPIPRSGSTVPAANYVVTLQVSPP